MMMTTIIKMSSQLHCYIMERVANLVWLEGFNEKEVLDITR